MANTNFKLLADRVNPRNVCIIVIITVFTPSLLWHHSQAQEDKIHWDWTNSTSASKRFKPTHTCSTV